MSKFSSWRDRARFLSGSHFIKRSVYKLWRSKPLVFMGLAFSVLLGAISSIWPSLILRQIVDSLMDVSKVEIWLLAALYLGAIVFIGLIDFVRELSAAVIGQNLLLEIKKDMLNHLQKLPMSYYNRVPIGENLSKFTADLDAVNTLFSAGLVSALADLFKIIGLVLALNALSSTVGLLALGSIPLVFVLTQYFRKRIFEKQKGVRQKVSEINAYIQEVYAGLRVVKLFGREGLFSEKFEEKLESHRMAMNGNSVYDAWFPCVMQVFRALVIATVLVVGATQNGTAFALGLSVGTLAAIADLLIRMFEPIEAIASEIQTIQQAFAGIERIEAFFNERVEEREQLSSALTEDENVRGDLVLDQVSFEYTVGKPIVKATNLTIKEGSKVAIAGRTGAGKSTLMALMAGLYPVTAGSVTIGGLDPFKLEASKRRKLIGIVPQQVQLLTGSIKDNITLRDLDIKEEAVWKAIETVGLTDLVKGMPQSIHTLVGEGEQMLSFGQMQLLALARAIVTEPPVLLLDELTSGLDALTERSLLTAIRQVSEKRTTVTISHRISGVIDADLVYIMDGGVIVESGRPEELTEQSGWYAIYKKLEERGWQVG